MNGYCGDCDPILHVPQFKCDTCGAETNCTDAEWAGDMILATFEMDHDRQRCGAPPRFTALVDPASDGPVRAAPAGNARRAANHYHIQDTGYPLGTQFCTVCNTPLPGGWNAWTCDQHRCAAATAYGTRCANKAKADGLCKVHITQQARRGRNGGAP